MKRRWGILVLSACCFLAVLVTVPRVEHTASKTFGGPCVLIDAGHGGADGGATGVDGTAEKAVNLGVSRTLALLLRVMGVSTVTTRMDDRSIHTEGDTLREQKVSDMHNRLAMYETASCVVSVHQNHFSEAKYHGAQVFCSPNHPQSRVLGTAVRESVIAGLQPDNTREMKTADDSVFLLSHTTVPAILVECGFLSNPSECEKLAQEDYQRQMAFVVAEGVFSFLQNANFGL